ncbi:MAG: preprotein translocase subunit SecG [Bacteroidales bacterium]|nr:preprotein translocase subunit SecG [Bacteroidales bacterium]
MYLVISVLIFIICVLLILIVLVQNSKGGGLAANFSSSNQIMGVRKTTDFLEKATWILGGAMMFLSVVGSFAIPRSSGVQESSAIEQQIQRAADPSAMPVFPVTPAATQETETTPAQGDSAQ